MEVREKGSSRRRAKGCSNLSTPRLPGKGLCGAGEAPGQSRGNSLSNGEANPHPLASLFLYPFMFPLPCFPDFLYFPIIHIERRCQAEMSLPVPFANDDEPFFLLRLPWADVPELARLAVNLNRILYAWLN